MLSSKLLREMEGEDNSKREQLLHGMQNLPLSSQIEKLKVFQSSLSIQISVFIYFMNFMHLEISILQARIDLIRAACEIAEKMLADMRKAYLFGTRQGLTIAPTLDKGQAAKIQEKENLLQDAVNFGEGITLKCLFTFNAF